MLGLFDASPDDSVVQSAVKEEDIVSLAFFSCKEKVMCASRWLLLSCLGRPICQNLHLSIFVQVLFSNDNYYKEETIIINYRVERLSVLNQLFGHSKEMGLFGTS